MIKILDTTLRDGSYVIDFQFTPRDTALIVSRLAAGGIDYIEVGHGLGLGAGTRQNMRLPEPDEAYLEAASSAAGKSKWGMFFIPGYGKLEDIRLAARYGMSFIRIGTNVTEVPASEEYIRLAKELGMFVFSNYMKTYALSSNEVGRNAALTESFGADILCVVDSAGGMFPSDIESYFLAIRNNSQIPIGFHGHNNLGMANANSLHAFKLGASVIDCSLRGMGRSSGNTVTEIFLLSIKRMGIELGIDINIIMDTAEKYIDPIIKNYSMVDSIGIISGYAQFHSSFLGKLIGYATKYSVDPRQLIVKLTNIDKVNAPDHLLEELCQSMLAEKQGLNSSMDFDIPTKSIPGNIEVNLEQKAIELTIRAATISKKWACSSLFNIVQGVREHGQSSVSDTINEDVSFAIASAELYSIADVEKLTNAIDGNVDFIMLDADIKSPISRPFVETVRNNAKKTPVLLYSDIDVWVRSVIRLATQLAGSIDGKKVLLAGGGILHSRLESVFFQMGAIMEQYSPDLLVFSGTEWQCSFDQIKSGIIVIDAWVGSLNENAIDILQKKSARICRVDMFATMQSEALAAVNSYTLVNKNIGFRESNGIMIASGGYLAPYGCVIVDSVNNPSRIIGIADGYGKLLPPSKCTKEHFENIDKVEGVILSTATNHSKYAS
jgi:4-hydroxy-2-oxovalerate aldolase